MTSGLFRDGPVMVLVDMMVIINIVVAISFIIQMIVRTKFEKSGLGRLILANAGAWLLLSLGVFMFRVHMPEIAQWLLLPIALGVPAVTAWWYYKLNRSFRARGYLQDMIDEWYEEGVSATKEGRVEEARIYFSHSTQLSRKIRA